MIRIIPKGGLGNRMRVIASAVALSKASCQKLTVVWLLNEELNCSFNQLFTNTSAFTVDERPTYIFDVIYKIFRFIFFGKKPKYISNEEIYSKRKLGWGAVEFKSFFDLLSEKYDLVVETDWSFYPTKTDKFNCLQPVDRLMDEVNLVLEKFNQNTVGVHVRRSDHLPAIEQSPLELFVDKMKEEKRNNPDTLFFLSTDSDVVQTELQQEFKDCLICYSREKRRDVANGIKEAVIDLHCLAATKKIFGSYFSSFSEIASELRGTPLFIVKK